MHRVLQPESSGPHPTVLMIHGRGGDENVMGVFARTLPADWLLVFPRAIFPDPIGGYSWHARAGNGFPAMLDLQPAIAALDELIQELARLYDADPTRLCAMGFSQGAALAFAFALTRPARLKAIASLVGFLPDNVPSSPRDATSLNGLPVFMANGLDDERVPIDRARQDAARVRGLGAELDYREYPVEHKLSPEGVRDLREWWSARAVPSL